MADLTNAMLRAKLPAGITLDALAYPDAETSLTAIADFLIAVELAQIEQNAAAPAGEDVQLIQVATGVEQNITRGGVIHKVVPVNRTVTVFEKRTVDQVFPVLA